MTTVRPTVTQTVAIATCPIDATLEYWDEELEIWRPQAELTTTSAGQDEHPSLSTFTNTFITNWVSVNTGYWDISISLADAGTEYDGPDDPHTEVQMKVTFNDPYSDEALNTVSDEFTVIIKNKCTLNELSVTETHDVLLQYVGDSTSSAYRLQYTTLYDEPPTWPACLITHTLEFWDETKELWIDYDTATADYPFIASWDSSTGDFTLYTNDYITHDNFSILARVSAEDLYSEVEGKDKVSDQFTIELRDECHDIVILENGS